MTRLNKKALLPWLLGGALVLATVVAYLPSFRGAFFFDDFRRIYHNPSIRSLTTVLAQFTRNSRPVVYLSLWLNYRSGGLEPFGYHAFNLAIHLAAGLTLFALVRGTLSLPLESRLQADLSTAPAKAGTRTCGTPTSDWIAFVVALLWMLHPLQTQSVTYIIQRSESMMGLFFLLSLYCVLRGSQAVRAWPWCLGGIVALWLGMGCKEVMFAAPPVILLYDRIFLSPSWASLFRRRWWFYLACLPAMVWPLVSLQHAMWGVSPAPSAATAQGSPNAASPEVALEAEFYALPSRGEYLMSQPAVLLHYLRLAIFPDRLCFDYMWPVSKNLSEVALPGLIVLALLAASMVALYYAPRIGFLGFSFFLILAPTSSVNPINDLAVEHRMYLPLAPLMAMAVVGCAVVLRRMLPETRQRALVGTVLVLVLASLLGLRTFSRNRLYMNPNSMWADVVENAPHNSRAHNNLGCSLLAEGDTPGAIEHLQRAVELDPKFTAAATNLARELGRAKRTREGIEVLQRMMDDGSREASVYSGLGELLEREGRRTEAVEQYRQAIELAPTLARAHYRLGRLLSILGQSAEAVPHLNAALRERPDDLACNFRLALAYQRCGKFAEAMEHYERVLKAAPQLDKARRNLELCLKGDRDGESPSDEDQPEKKAGEPPAGLPRR